MMMMAASQNANSKSVTAKNRIFLNDPHSLASLLAAPWLQPVGFFLTLCCRSAVSSQSAHGDL